MALAAARRIVRDEGIDRLSARGVARGIGYTVGTIYQLFDNMDALVEQMNAETLDGLHDACANQPLDGEVGDRLLILAASFVRYAGDNPREWNAIVSYHYSPGHRFSANYNSRVEKLLGLMLAATAALYGPEEVQSQLHDMRVLWASLYGMFSLDAAQRLGDDESVDRMSRTLVRFYLASRNGQRRG